MGKEETLGGVGFILILLLLLLIINPVLIMLLWNWLMPPLFGLGKIGFWKAVGISMLSTILFKSQTPRYNKY